jgi:hypothetical protein
MRSSTLLLLAVLAGCAALDESSLRDRALQEQATACDAAALADEALLGAAQIVAVEPYQILLSS